MLWGYKKGRENFPTLTKLSSLILDLKINIKKEPRLLSLALLCNKFNTAENSNLSDVHYFF